MTRRRLFAAGRSYARQCPRCRRYPTDEDAIMAASGALVSSVHCPPCAAEYRKAWQGFIDRYYPDPEPPEAA